MGFLRQLRCWKKAAFGSSRGSRIFPTNIDDIDDDYPDLEDADDMEVKKVFHDKCDRQAPQRGSTPGSSPSESTCDSATSAEASDVTSTQTSEGPETVRDESDVPGMVESTQDGPQLIDFDLQLHEFAYVVAAEFGPEVARCLQSSKWDQRQRALHMMSSDLNGVNLQWLPPGTWQRDRRDAWRTSCQVLSHALEDKVVPVQLAALQLFRDTFENIDAGVTAEEVQHALDVLITPVMACLGDSNVRLHESAQSNLVFTRYLLGDKLLYRLRDFLETSSEADDGRAHFGVLDTVNALLCTSPFPSPWRLEDLSIFITADNRNPRVRHSVVALAGNLYRLHGPPCVEMLMENLRPAQRNLLREKFREIDEEWHPASGLFAACDCEGEIRPDLDDLLHCMKAVPVPEPSTGDEDLMDGILEETGRVFSGSCIASGRSSRGSGPRKSVTFCLSDDIVELERPDEELILEHEALCLGVDWEDDTEALLREILMDEVSDDEVSDSDE